MFKKMMLLVVCSVISSTVLADCVKRPNGKVICSNGEEAGSYNPNTGNARKAEINGNGVTTTQNSRGGQAKTKNGVGVATTANGTTCVKTRNNQGCR